MYSHISNIIPYQRILVVEDDPNIASLIKSMLENNHFEVHVFDNPFLSLAVFKDDPIGYGLIICDMSIKQMSAFEFLRHIREENPDIKFIMITTIQIKPAEFAKMLPSVTVDGFLEKQFLANQILPCVNKILASCKIGKSNLGKYR